MMQSSPYYSSSSPSPSLQKQKRPPLQQSQQSASQWSSTNPPPPFLRETREPKRKLRSPSPLYVSTASANHSAVIPLDSERRWRADRFTSLPLRTVVEEEEEEEEEYDEEDFDEEEPIERVNPHHNYHFVESNRPYASRPHRRHRTAQSPVAIPTSSSNSNSRAFMMMERASGMRTRPDNVRPVAAAAASSSKQGFGTPLNARMSPSLHKDKPSLTRAAAAAAEVFERRAKMRVAAAASKRNRTTRPNNEYDNYEENEDEGGVHPAADLFHNTATGGGGSGVKAEGEADWAALHEHLRLRTHTTHITNLNLVSLRLSDAQWLWLGRSILPTLENLTSLSLRDAGLTDSHFAQLFYGTQRRRSRIVAGRASIGDEGSEGGFFSSQAEGEERGGGISKTGNKSNQTSDAPDVQFGPYLSSLDLSHNALTYQSMQVLGKEILARAGTLMELSLAGNPLQDHGLQNLSVYLAKFTLESLTRERHLFPRYLVKAFVALQHAQRQLRRRQRLSLYQKSNRSRVVAGAGRRRGVLRPSISSPLNAVVEYEDNDDMYGDANSVTLEEEEEEANEIFQQIRQFPLGLVSLDVRSCQATARGLSSLLSGASKAYRLSTILASHNDTYCYSPGARQNAILSPSLKSHDVSASASGVGVGGAAANGPPLLYQDRDSRHYSENIRGRGVRRKGRTISGGRDNDDVDGTFFEEFDGDELNSESASGSSAAYAAALKGNQRREQRLVQPTNGISTIEELQSSASLAMVSLAHVPLSRYCTPKGCRELFLNLFFCCPQLDAVDLSSTFDMASAIGLWEEDDESVRDLEHVLLGGFIEEQDLNEQLNPNQYPSTQEFVLSTARFGRQARVGDVLAELIAHAGWNAALRHTAVPSAFLNVRELYLSGTGLTDEGALGLVAATRSSQYSNTCALLSLAVLDVSENFLSASGCCRLLAAFCIQQPHRLVARSSASPSVTPEPFYSSSSIRAIAIQGNYNVRSQGDLNRIYITIQDALALKQEDLVRRQREKARRNSSRKGNQIFTTEGAVGDTNRMGRAFKKSKNNNEDYYDDDDGEGVEDVGRRDMDASADTLEILFGPYAGEVYRAQAAAASVVFGAEEAAAGVGKTEASVGVATNSPRTPRARAAHSSTRHTPKSAPVADSSALVVSPFGTVKKVNAKGDTSSSPRTPVLAIPPSGTATARSSGGGGGGYAAKATSPAALLEVSNISKKQQEYWSEDEAVNELWWTPRNHQQPQQQQPPAPPPPSSLSFSSSESPALMSFPHRSSTAMPPLYPSDQRSSQQYQRKPDSSSTTPSPAINYPKRKSLISPALEDESLVGINSASSSNNNPNTNRVFQPVGYPAAPTFPTTMQSQTDYIVDGDASSTSKDLDSYKGDDRVHYPRPAKKEAEDVADALEATLGDHDVAGGGGGVLFRPESFLQASQQVDRKMQQEAFVHAGAVGAPPPLNTSGAAATATSSSLRYIVKTPPPGIRHNMIRSANAAASAEATPHIVWSTRRDVTRTSPSPKRPPPQPASAVTRGESRVESASHHSRRHSPSASSPRPAAGSSSSPSATPKQSQERARNSASPRAESASVSATPLRGNRKSSPVRRDFYEYDEPEAEAATRASSGAYEQQPSSSAASFGLLFSSGQPEEEDVEEVREHHRERSRKESKHGRDRTPEMEKHANSSPQRSGGSTTPVRSTAGARVEPSAGVPQRNDKEKEDDDGAAANDADFMKHSPGTDANRDENDNETRASESVDTVYRDRSFSTDTDATDLTSSSVKRAEEEGGGRGHKTKKTKKVKKVKRRPRLSEMMEDEDGRKGIPDQEVPLVSDVTQGDIENVSRHVDTSDSLDPALTAFLAAASPGDAGGEMQDNPWGSGTERAQQHQQESWRWSETHNGELDESHTDPLHANESSSHSHSHAHRHRQPRPPKTFTLSYAHPEGHILCRGWRLLHRSDDVGEEARRYVEADVLAFLQPPSEGFLDAVEDNGDAVVESVTIRVGDIASSVLQMQITSNERRAVIAARLQEKANIENSASAFPRFSLLVGIGEPVEHTRDFVALVDHYVQQILSMNDDDESGKDGRKAAASAKASITELMRSYDGSVTALVHDQHGNEEDLVAYLVGSTGGKSKTTTIDEEKMGADELKVDLPAEHEEAADEFVAADEEKQIPEKHTDPNESAAQDATPPQSSSLEEQQQSRDASPNAAPSIAVVESPLSIDNTACGSEEYEEVEMEVDEEVEEEELEEEGEEEGNSGATNAGDDNEYGLVLRKRIPRSPSKLSGRVKAFTLSYAHPEGHILCRGWRLLHRSDAIGDEARRCVEEDVLDFMQPPDDELDHTVESVSLVKGGEGVSAVLKLEVKTNERRATVSDRLQAASGAAAAKDNGQTHFPRFTAFVTQKCNADFVAFIDAQVAALSDAAAATAMLKSFKNTESLVHYHHGTETALLESLGCAHGSGEGVEKYDQLITDAHQRFQPRVPSGTQERAALKPKGKKEKKTKITVKKVKKMIRVKKQASPTSQHVSHSVRVEEVEPSEPEPTVAKTEVGEEGGEREGGGENEQVRGASPNVAPDAPIDSSTTVAEDAAQDRFTIKRIGSSSASSHAASFSSEVQFEVEHTDPAAAEEWRAADGGSSFHGRIESDSQADLLNNINAITEVPPATDGGADVRQLNTSEGTGFYVTEVAPHTAKWIASGASQIERAGLDASVAAKDIDEEENRASNTLYQNSAVKSYDDEAAAAASAMVTTPRDQRIPTDLSPASAPSKSPSPTSHPFTVSPGRASHISNELIDGRLRRLQKLAYECMCAGHVLLDSRYRHRVRCGSGKWGKHRVTINVEWDGLLVIKTDLGTFGGGKVLVFVHPLADGVTAGSLADSGLATKQETEKRTAEKTLVIHIRQKYGPNDLGVPRDQYEKFLAKDEKRRRKSHIARADTTPSWTPRDDNDNERGASQRRATSTVAAYGLDNASFASITSLTGGELMMSQRQTTFVVVMDSAKKVQSAVATISEGQQKAVNMLVAGPQEQTAESGGKGKGKDAKKGKGSLSAAAPPSHAAPVTPYTPATVTPATSPRPLPKPNSDDD